jgi:competence protein ComEC
MQQKRSVLDLSGLMLVFVAAAWLAGILLEAWGQTWAQVPPVALLAGAAMAGVGALAFWRNSRMRLVALLAACLLLGAWRYATVSPAADPTAIRAYIGTKALEVAGTIADEPSLEGRSSLLIVDTQQVSLDQGRSWRGAHGQLDVTILGNLLDDPYGPHYGDVVEVQGTLQAPSPNSSPAIFASMTFPRLSIQQSGGNPFIAALYQLRTALALFIERSLPQPMAALLIALVLSLRTPALLPLISTFNNTGTAHLIAPSGLKITILAGLISSAAQRLAPGRTRGQQLQYLLPAERRRRDWLRLPATGLVVASIIVYTFLSGGGPAALRAGIMGIILVLAPRNSRVYNVYTALALSALLESGFDPFVLWDAGFQLSFLGTLGIVLLTPLWMRLLHPLERFWLGGFIAETIAVTLAAEIATLPIFGLTFHTLSLIAPLTNILTVPLLASLIFLGLLLCGSGLIAPPAALVVGWLIWPLLWYVLAIISWCARLPGAYLSMTNLNGVIAWVYYGALALVVSLLLRRWPLSTPGQSSLLTGHPTLAAPPQEPKRLSRRARRITQAGLALLLFLVTGTAALAAHPGSQVTITFLNVVPARQPPQGEAILIRTPDGKTALIDGGPDAASLAEALDSHLPFWQRSLDLVMLTSPRQENLVGLYVRYNQSVRPGVCPERRIAA